MSETTKTNDNIIRYTKKSYDDYDYHKKPPIRRFKGSLMNVIKMALYMLRRKGDKTNKKTLSPSLSLPPTTNVTLTDLVGAIRPFHLQRDVGGGISPPPPPTQLHLPPGNGVAEVVVVVPPPPTQLHLPGGDGVVVVAPDEISQASSYHPKYAASSSSSRSSSLGGGEMIMSSRYTSAQSLYDLDNHDDEDEDEDDMMLNDEDAYYDGLEGDEMIDDKADKFIAKFYQQMRLQKF
ncbi:uncharacterized protein [Spinacia oleracea]|uniref:Uncharacterized protein n=1 Tax=Spinacia oleracea TaxID=3562 RepID=A0A9R0HSI5_SPIOL|nr:uncharacterized protein LOC110775900 [Spinacia oleracea]